MEEFGVKIGDKVRHRHLLLGTDLSVIAVGDETLTVRYANNGVFLSQELFHHEIKLVVTDEDEYL